MSTSSECPLTQIFNIEHGNKLDLNKMDVLDDGQSGVSFVGRSGEANGIVANVAELTDVSPYAAGLITVALGGSALSSFVQPEPFYTAQNIDVLTPRADMSLDEKLFYCLCIEANRFRYSTFGREANRTLKQLSVPSRKAVPSWVKGTTIRAAKELSGDLLSVAQQR